MKSLQLLFWLIALGTNTHKGSKSIHRLPPEFIWGGFHPLRVFFSQNEVGLSSP